MVYKKRSKSLKRYVETAIAHVQSTFNNTIVSITTLGGDVLLRGSAGALGFKGPRKSTPFAASQIASTLSMAMGELGISKVEVNLQGPGSGRDSVVRSFHAAGFNVTVLRDVTGMPHNGVRPPKKRRV
jgi:small subunit ribosomal protein S11